MVTGVDEKCRTRLLADASTSVRTWGVQLQPNPTAPCTPSFDQSSYGPRSLRLVFSQPSEAETSGVTMASAGCASAGDAAKVEIRSAAGPTLRLPMPWKAQEAR